MGMYARLYSDLVDKVKTVIDERYIYPSNRPNVGKNDQTMKNFIVIDLPDNIVDIAAGKPRLMLVTTGIISVFVKAKSDNTLKVNETSDLIDEVLDLFPISGEYCAAVNPVPLMRGSDGYGYQFTDIKFEIHTK